MSVASSEDTLPERMLIRLDRGYMFLMGLGSLVFIAAGFWMIHDPFVATRLFGWAGIIFFGLCAIISLLELIAPEIAFIELTSDGFRVVDPPWRRSRTVTPWRNVATIEVFRWQARLLPQYGVRIGYGPLQSPTKIQSPRKYGYSPEDLAALMNRFRDRALAASAS